MAALETMCVDTDIIIDYLLLSTLNSLILILGSMLQSFHVIPWHACPEFIDGTRESRKTKRHNRLDSASSAE